MPSEPAQWRHAMMPAETTEDVIVRSLSADQEDAMGEGGERTRAARRGGEKLRRFVWLVFAVTREIVAWAWEKMPRPRPNARTVTVMTAIAIGVLCVYAGVMAVLYLTQRYSLYFPEPVPTTPAQPALPQAEEVALTTSDGVHIAAWHVPPRDG